jgi:hypothetical protein
MAFFRAGPTIVELVGAPGVETRLWGLVAVVPSVDDPYPALAPHLGEPRDAVQPGRRSATLRTSAGIGTAVAFMTPRPGGPRRSPAHLRPRLHGRGRSD